MELREKLRWGDMRAIAELAGVHTSTVEKTLYRGRNNEKVKRAAQLLIESREELKAKIKQ